MGNPHAVVFVDDVANFELEKYGPLFENHKMFPKRTNTEFVEILSRNEAKMRVWERGSAETGLRYRNLCDRHGMYTQQKD